LKTQGAHFQNFLAKKLWKNKASLQIRLLPKILKKDFFKSRMNLVAHNLSNCCLTDTTHSHIPTMRTSGDSIFNKDSTLLTWSSIPNRPVVWLEDMACNLHLWVVISPQQSFYALVRGAVISGWWGKING